MVIKMFYEESKNNKRVIFGNLKNEILFLENGNLRIDYVKENRIYIVTKRDKTPFDYAERVEKMVYGEVQEESFENTLELLVDALTLIQFIPEAFMFNEFYYEISTDKKSIIITPKFYESELSTSVKLEDEAPTKFGFALRKQFKAIKK